jgi:hypothetical protein
MCDHETAVSNKYFGTIPGMILEARVRKEFPELFVPATLYNTVFLNLVCAYPKVVFDKMTLSNKYLVTLSEREAVWTKERFLGVFRAISDSSKHLQPCTVLNRARGYKLFFRQVFDCKASWLAAIDQELAKLELESLADSQRTKRWLKTSPTNIAGEIFANLCPDWIEAMAAEVELAFVDGVTDGKKAFCLYAFIIFCK